MNIVGFIIEQLHPNGTIDTISLYRKKEIGDLWVAFANEYDEIRNSPFHFMDQKYEEEYYKKLLESKPRKLSTERLFLDNDNLWNFKSSWKSIPTRHPEIDYAGFYYSLFLPKNAILLEVTNIDLKTNDIYRRSMKALKDEKKGKYIIYIECYGDDNSFELSIKYKIDEKEFQTHQINQEKIFKHYYDDNDKFLNKFLPKEKIELVNQFDNNTQKNKLKLKLNNLIGQAQILETLKVLKEHSEREKLLELEQEVILLTSRWNDLRREIDRGTIFYDNKIVSRNKIVDSILSLINSIED